MEFSKGFKAYKSDSKYIPKLVWLVTVLDMFYRDLAGIGYSSDEIKAIKGQYEVKDDLTMKAICF